MASRQCLLVHLGLSSQQIYDRKWIVSCPEGALDTYLAFFFPHRLGHVCVSAGQVDCFLALQRLGPSPSPGRLVAENMVRWPRVY